MRFDIITIFPEVLRPYFNESILGRAQKKKLIKINIHDLRDYTRDKHRTVDDKPYGGGPGMVLMVEPILKAVNKVRGKNRTRVVLLSAKGKKFDQKMAKRFSGYDQLILVSGRYEGVDERVAKYIADEEISVGDYILTGGELPAAIIVDAVSRLVPKVIDKESLKEESFSKENKLEYPHYTRPEKIKVNRKERKVPEVLLSGNHKEIKEWRKKHLTKKF